MPSPHALHQIFARRWTVPILALLANEGGCKFVTLTSRLEGSRDSLKASLELLNTLGFVSRNTGLGHPMRPEYILTSSGTIVSQPAAALVHALDRVGSIELGLKKWSMPTLHAVNMGSDRFSLITSSLGLATDRAVSLALGDMHNASMIRRDLIDGRPPFSSYHITGRAKNIVPILRDIDSALGASN
ncbi:MAG: winged helix-turn-helix transcriptional regulator [Phycisphaerales bacterium]|nr:winged helix-turn-helix transcriptional regulator [Phycisphaerales bacterium]